MLLPLLLLPVFAVSWGRFGLRFLAAVVVSLLTGFSFFVIKKVFCPAQLDFSYKNIKCYFSDFYWLLFIVFPIFIPLGLPLWVIPLNLALSYLVSISSFGGVGKQIFNPIVICIVFLAYGYSANTSIVESVPFKDIKQGFVCWSSGMPPTATNRLALEKANTQELIKLSLAGLAPALPGNAFPFFLLFISFLIAANTPRIMTWWISSIMSLTTFSLAFSAYYSADISAALPFVSGIIPALILVAVSDQTTLPDCRLKQFLSSLVFVFFALLFQLKSENPLFPAYAFLLTQFVFSPYSTKNNATN